jgi:hypothetical protein
LATVKYRFEQIQITPPGLKYKTWSDFTGEIKDIDQDGNLVTIEQLDPEVFVVAKQRAMEYCFGSHDPKVLEDRQKHRIVHNHAKDGQNLIIAGDRQTGRTMLAAIVLKEVVYADAHHCLDIEFRAMKASELINAARWDNNRTIDHVYLDELVSVDFLLIDGVSIPKPKIGHTVPADHIALDVFFRERRMDNHPTIVVCSDEFWRCASHPNYVDLVSRHWGEEFVDLLLDPTNVVIELQKRSEVGSGQE